MTNILIEGEHISSYDLTVIAFERYSKHIPIDVRPILTRHITREDIKWCDIFLSVRGSNPLSEYLCRYAKKNNRKVILVLDDDLLEYTSNEHRLYDKIRKQSLRSVISLSDVILTPSLYLGEKYKKLFSRGYVLINTVVEPEDFKTNHIDDSKVRLVYASGHMYHFQQLIMPILKKVFEKYGDKISLTIIGVKPDLTDKSIPMEFVPQMQLHEYREFMKTRSFDIGFAPLIDTEMTRSKYFNKYLEYTIQGICGIYSNNLPYSSAVKNGVNGILAENSPEFWYEAICKLIDTPDLRKECVINAQNELKANFSIRNILNHLCTDFPDLVTYKANNNIKFGFKMPSFPLFLTIELIRRILKRLIWF